MLGGEVLTRLTAAGERAYTYVPAGGLVQARQGVQSWDGQPAVEWAHRDPPGLSEPGAAYDPLGNHVGVTNPAAGQPPGDAGTGEYTGNYSGQVFDYDELGRRVRQTNPAEVTAAWALAGDDTGWVYTLRSYDWRGRPLTTTRQADGSTTVVDYGRACGCAGGGVVTVSGEVVMLPPQGGSGAWTPGRRRRRTYHDVLGRAVKTEVLNNDGTPYRTTVTDYNARDQVTAVREYKGAALSDGSCPSGTCQQTAMTYDGHGRLQTHQAPEQTAPTRYSYNNDDTTAAVTDPREATRTYRYFNNRRLVNEIVYGAPLGVQQAATLTFTYDAAATGRRRRTRAGRSLTSTTCSPASSRRSASSPTSATRNTR